MTRFGFELDEQYGSWSGAPESRLSTADSVSTLREASEKTLGSWGANHR